MAAQSPLETLETEIELISASLMPDEALSCSESRFPLDLSIYSAVSQRAVDIHLQSTYPNRGAVSVELRGSYVGRLQSLAFQEQLPSLLEEWDEHDEYPLYQFVTTRLLPIIGPDKALESTQPNATQPEPTTPQPTVLHHALLTSHHLLSPTKRKNFISLSSSLSLTGFSKVGHPGIYYAIGAEQDIAEWIQEVKSWNWLALRVRVGNEPVPDEYTVEVGGRGKESGARGGKGRGEWSELEKISEALEWMRNRGAEQLLLDIGIGATSSTS